MNTKLLFTLAMAGTASAAGPNADFSSRNLEAAWSGSATGTGNDADGCKFLPISDLFQFEMDAYDENTWTPVLEESQLAPKGHSTNSGLIASGMPITDFHSSEIHVASVDIVFSLQNFDETSQDNARRLPPTGRTWASQNYLYEKWAANAWSEDESLIEGRTADGEQRPGTELMATICFYKPKYSVTNTLQDSSSGNIVFGTTPTAVDANTPVGKHACPDKNGVTVFRYPVSFEGAQALPTIEQADIEDTTSSTYAEAKEFLSDNVQRTVDSHKTLGVSSTCGTDTDIYELASGAGIHDVFTWAVAKATGVLDYQIKLTIDRGTDNHNAYLANTAINGDTSGNKFDEPDIYLTVTLEHTHKTVPHDLLYISGDASPETQSMAVQSSPNNDMEDFNIEMNAFLSGDVRWVDDDGSGDNGVFDVAVDCTAELVVTSADGEWHCFDEAEGVPTSTNFDTHSNQVFNASNGDDGTAMNSANDCTAYMRQQCVIDEHTIKIEDKRHCYNVEDGDSNDEVCTDDEVKNNWPAIAPKAEVTFDAHAAIVQAIRLNNARRYPKGDDANADDYVNAGDNYVTENSLYARQNSKFLCDDNDCSTRDPYVVLASQSQHRNETNGLNVECYSDNGGGSFASPSPITTGCADDPYAAGGCTTASVHAVTCDTESPARLPAGNDEVTLQLPPADFPQFYVFGISTIRSYQSDETTKSDEDADHDSGTYAGEHTETQGSNIPNEKSVTYPSRRLGARVGEPAQRRVLSERTTFVSARTAVVSK